MDELTGKMIGRYKVLESIDKGGMAVVYKAMDTHLERLVAIKLILPQDQHNEIFVRRFDREAKSLAKLSHPGIVGIHDYGTYEGAPFLVMEYVRGGNLKTLMKGPMQYEEAIHLLLPVVEALEYAHKQGFVHRDVKPSNILLDENGKTMLSDFGIVKLAEQEKESQELTRPGSGIGTPEYMSPEQGQGLAIDERSDVYSLGIVFYELVTGKKPFKADTPMSVLVQHATAPLPRPRDSVPSLPDRVEKLIFKALAKNPEFRFRNMGDLKEEFLGILMAADRMRNEQATRIQEAPKPANDVKQVETRIDGQYDSANEALPEPVFQYPSATQSPRTPEPSPNTGIVKNHEKKSKKTIYFLVGGVILLGLCLVFLLVGGSVMIFGEELSALLSPNNEPSITQVLAEMESATTAPEVSQTPLIPTQEPSIALSATDILPIDENVTALWPLFGDSNEVRAEIEKAAEERVANIYDKTELISETDLVSEYKGSLSITEDILISRGWCTTTQEILDENMQKISYELEINSRIVYESFSYGAYYENSEGNPCYFVTYLTLEWPPGHYDIDFRMIIHENLNDGWEDFTPATHRYRFDVTVNP